MKEQYRLIKEKITNEIVIDKSIFICNLIPIKNKEEADFYLKEINKWIITEVKPASEVGDIEKNPNVHFFDIEKTGKKLDK